MKRINYSILVALTLFSVVSCTNDVTDGVENNQPVEQRGENLSVKDATTLKKKFANALAKVLEENQEVRDLIKNEALKKIDHDYDVLYLLVKDKKMSNGETLENLLSKHVDADTLTSIEQKIPTLTILVPTLPENSFSAETWNTDIEIPYIGVRLCHENFVPVYDSKGKETILEENFIPTCPILVVKECERMTVANKASTSNVMTRASSGTQLTLIDDIFDNFSDGSAATREQRSTRERGTQIEIPQKYQHLIDAYKTFHETKGWQRDKIYYNLTPTQTQGPFNYNMKEYIVGFQFIGDGFGVIDKISGQTGDPNRANIDEPYVRDQNHHWTDGEFEFQVKIYLGNKAGFGNELITYFRAKPKELFTFKYFRDSRGGIPGYSYQAVYTNAINLLIPLFEWNLETYSANVKLAVEEVDPSETYKSTTTTTAEFATNFGFSVSGEVEKKVKLGLEFGISQKETRTIAYETTTTVGNDLLGEVIVNFYDDVVTDSTVYEGTGPSGRKTSPSTVWAHFNTKYHTGWYRIFIAPLKTN